VVHRAGNPIVSVRDDYRGLPHKSKTLERYIHNNSKKNNLIKKKATHECVAFSCELLMDAMA
jgi:hypothetical protein